MIGEGGGWKGEWTVRDEVGERTQEGVAPQYVIHQDRGDGPTTHFLLHPTSTVLNTTLSLPTIPHHESLYYHTLPATNTIFRSVTQNKLLGWRWWYKNSYSHNKHNIIQLYH